MPAAKTGLGTPPNELLHLFEKPRAVGLVLVRHELARRSLVFSFPLRLRLACVQTWQLSLHPVVLALRRRPAA
jgi:hypothetical protein